MLVLFLSLSVFLSAIALSYSQTTTVDDAQAAVHAAYKALVKAYSEGRDISQLTDQLNLALNYTTQAQALDNTDPQQAQDLASQAQMLAQNVTAQAPHISEDALFEQHLILGASAAGLIVGGVLVYLLGPKVFWKTWLKLRKNYRVKTQNLAAKNKGLVITIEHVCVLILAVALILAFLATSQFFLPTNNGEAFSELGILGPNMTLGDYPSQIVAGASVNLNVYVGNQMGRPMYYTIMIKLGNNETTVDPASVAPLQQYARIVPSNGTWTFPVHVALNQAGANQRIIFELWMYNETLNQNQYHQRWGQIWLNVTAPAP